MIYMLFSDDYELYLGGNYRPEKEVLLDTTAGVLGVCEELRVPLTLFADVASFWRYREVGQPEVAEQFETQLRDAACRGHDVQVHLHPHWLATEIQRGPGGSTRYQFDRSKFLLGNWGEGEELRHFVAGLFTRARRYLEDLLRPVCPQYECVAYRAGGYGLQPGERAILAGCADAGLAIDSSIIPGFRQISNVNRIDFSGLPRSGNYRLSAERGLDGPADRGLFEIPVAASRYGPATAAAMHVRQVIRYLKKRTGILPRSRPLGYAVQDDTGEGPAVSRSIVAKAWRYAREFCRPGLSSLELGPDPRFMLHVTRQYLRSPSPAGGDVYFALSCHSKMVTPIMLDALRTYHRALRRIYGSSLATITYQQAARQIASS